MSGDVSNAAAFAERLVGRLGLLALACRVERSSGFARSTRLADAIAARYRIRTAASGLAMIRHLPGTGDVNPAGSPPTRVVAPLLLRFALAFNWSGSGIGAHDHYRADRRPGTPLRTKPHPLARLVERGRRVVPELPRSATHRPPGSPQRPADPNRAVLALGDDPSARLPEPRARLDIPAMVHRRSAAGTIREAAEPATDHDVQSLDPISIAARLRAKAGRAPAAPPAPTHADIERVATEVLTVIDRRLAAHRERVGRI
jgi:hypothetical protein